jgi:hypothetical protein
LFIVIIKPSALFIVIIKPSALFIVIIKPMFDRGVNTTDIYKSHRVWFFPLV